MSLLDTFVMVFQADTKSAVSNIEALEKSNNDLEQSADDTRKALDKQLESLSKQEAETTKTKNSTTKLKAEQDLAAKSSKDLADASDKASSALTEQETSVAGLIGKMAGVAAASFSAAAILGGVFERANAIRAIEQTSDALGIAIEDVDAFGKAAEVMGGDAEGARDSLTDMAEAMGEALADKESGRAEAFKKLGINIADANGKAKDGLTGILDLAKAVEGMSKSEAIFKIKELGITDNRTVEMVLKGRQELERMLKVQKQQGVVTKESAENARKLTEAMGALKGSLASTGAGFMDAIIPALTSVIEWLSKGISWMGEHQDFVLGFFAAIAGVVAAIYLPAMTSAAIATLAATWPLIAIGAAITAAAAAFALIYDDIMNFVAGNDSFIGQISEKYPIVGQTVLWLIDTFKALWDTLVTGAQQIGEFVANGFMQVVDGIKYAVDYLAEAYAKFQEFTQSTIDLFSGMGDAIAAIFAAIVDGIKGALSFASAGMEKIKGGISGVASFFGIGGDDSGGGIDQSMAAAGAQLSAASSAPTNSITSSAISNSTSKTSNEVNVGQITVQTQATDAQGMASETKSELQSQLKDLEYQSATGVAR